jgi:hypothetical protein
LLIALCETFEKILLLGFEDTAVFNVFEVDETPSETAVDTLVFMLEPELIVELVLKLFLELGISRGEDDEITLV